MRIIQLVLHDCHSEMMVAELELLPQNSGMEPQPAAPETDVIEEERTDDKEANPWNVILYNDEIHTFDEVIRQLVKATGCTESKAEEHAWTVHTKGKDLVYSGSFEDCLEVSGVLKEIQLVTQIEG